MRIVLKILAAPFVAILTVLWAFLTFVFCFAEAALGYAAGLGVLVAVGLFVMRNNTGGVVFLILSFLLSPLGLPAVAGWLIDKIADLNDSLKFFIAT
jgi:hypothetical protein